LRGRVTELSLGSALHSDYIEGMKNIDNVPAKALLIRDLGYFAPKVLKEINRRDIYFISRAKSQWRFYIKQGNKQIVLTTQDIINKLKNQKEKYLDIEVVVGAEARTPVRLIANLLSDEQTAKRLKKKTENRGKPGKDAQEGVCLNLFVTNIAKDKCEASTIYQLYTLRWKIELIFKTWKSILKIHKLQSMNATRLECIILIKFLWVMLNWSLLNLVQEETRQEISLHKFTHTVISRSKILTATILRSRNLFSKWIIGMCNISIRYHVKEYKIGSLSEPEILSQTYFKIA
jgi:IS4 transposase